MPVRWIVAGAMAACISAAVAPAPCVLRSVSTDAIDAVGAAPGRREVLVVLAPGCAPSRSMGRSVETASDELRGGGVTLHVARGAAAEHALARFALAGAPAFVALEEGRVVDRHVGGATEGTPGAHEINRSLLRHFLRRSGVVPGPLTYVEDLRGIDWSGERLVGDRPAADLEGSSLRGARLRNVSLSGANLRHADLSGARLDGVDFTAANLAGANLAGAVFVRVAWDHTVCPCGHSSDDVGRTCEGHLEGHTATRRQPRSGETLDQ